MEHPIKMDDFGVPLFLETPMLRDIYTLYMSRLWYAPLPPNSGK